MVALRAIQPGEQILIDSVRDSDTGEGYIQVEDGIYSDVWKDYKVAK